MSDRNGEATTTAGTGEEGGYDDENGTWEKALITAGMMATGAAFLVLATGHVSAWIFERGWPRYEVGEAPGIVWRVIENPLDPAEAWAPVNVGTEVPGAVAWWAVYFVFVLRLAAAVGFLRKLVQKILLGVPNPVDVGTWLPRGSSRRRAATGGWASWREWKQLQPKRDDDVGIVVGKIMQPSFAVRTAHAAVGKDRHRPVAIRGRDSLLLIGPTGAGKASGVVIPALLDWPGLAVVVTPKVSVIDHTIGWRSRAGDVHLFDPVDSTRYIGSRWSPFADCHTWIGAARTARELADAAHASAAFRVDRPQAFGHLVAKAMAPYLFAASLMDRRVGELVDWIDREDKDEVLEVLRSAHLPLAGAHHEATFRLDERTREAVFEMMQAIVDPYLDPAVARTAERHEIVADELLDGRPQTLYVTTPYHDRSRFRPVCAAVVRQVITRAYAMAAASGRPLSPPVLLVLDEGSGIAPTADLKNLAASAAASGIQVVTIFEDVPQIVDRYGDAAHNLVNNHRAKLYLPSRMDFESVRSPAGNGEPSNGVTGESTEAILRRVLLPPAHARQLADGEAVLLHGNLAPIRVKIRPWYRSKRLRQQVDVPQDVLVPGPGSGLTGTGPLDDVDSRLPPSPPAEAPSPNRSPIEAPTPTNVLRLIPRRRSDK